MKTKILTIFRIIILNAAISTIVLLFFSAACTLAADVIVAAETATTPAFNWMLTIIPIAVPLIIAGIKWLAPKTPKVILPILVPVLGAGLEIVLHFAGLPDIGAGAGAALGGLGLVLREALDQAKKLLT